MNSTNIFDAVPDFSPRDGDGQQVFLTGVPADASSEHNPWMTQAQAESVFNDIKSKRQLVEAIVSSINDAEFRALNVFESLRPHCRITGRGTLAEMFSLSYVSKATEPLGFIYEEENGHCRLLNLNDFAVPLRFYICRGNDVDGQIQTWKKGRKAMEMVNENFQQLKLFEWIASQDGTGGQMYQEDEKNPILNAWIVADAYRVEEGTQDYLKIHLVAPTKVERQRGTWAKRPFLVTAVRLTLWEGQLGAPVILPKDMPQAEVIDVPRPMLRPDAQEEQAL